MSYLQDAEALASAVTAGEYTPTALDTCDATIALDRDSYVVRFVEFTLFKELSRPRTPEPRVLILQPQKVRQAEVAKEEEEARTREVRSLIQRWEKALESLGLATGKKHTAATARAAIGQFSRNKHIGSRVVGARGARTLPKPPPLDLDDSEIVSRYERWAELAQDAYLSGELQVLGVATATVPYMFSRHGITLPDLENALMDFVLPSPYQPFDDPHAPVALCAIYEQTWKPLGYTRGELVSSLTLAPGEQVTLEIHSWDKSTRKSEEELSTEFEMRTSEKITQRDALTVAQEYSKNRNSSVSASGTIPVPKMPISASAQVSTETRQSLARTREQIREQSLEASTTLKLNRKTRVEVSRDVGREQRQTRVIENTNRCHTLNCHYFEVVANYEVTTRLASVQPCVLLPNLRPDFTLDWILCHEGILIEAILDPAVLDGFKAARVIKAERIADEMRRKARLQNLEGQSEQLFGPTVSVILASYGRLKQAKTQAEAVVADCGYGKTTCFLGNIGEETLSQLIVWFALPIVARTALERLEADKTSGVSSADAIRTFISTVAPQIFDEPRSKSAIASDIGALVGGVGYGYQALVFTVLQKVKSALDSEEYVALGSAVAAAAELATSSIEPSAAEVPDEARHAAVAEAIVEFERLKCHLEANWLHYSQAVWVRENHGQRFLRLQRDHAAISPAIENVLLGFHADRSAYPLTDLAAVTELNLSAVLAEALREVEAGEGDPVLVSMPTPGLVLEATIGACDACEDFIQQSRQLDLRAEEAKARQMEAEADRRSARLTEGDLSSPDPAPGRLVVEVKMPSE